MFMRARHILRSMLCGRVVGADSTEFKVECVTLLANLGSRLFRDKPGPKIYFETRQPGTRLLVIDFAQYRFIRGIRFSDAFLSRHADGVSRDYVHFSVDALRWNDLGQTGQRITTTISDGIVSMEFATSIATRFVAFAVKGLGSPTMDRFEFEQVLPPVKFGALGDMSADEGHMSCDYLSTHTFGLFSNCSTSLADVIRLGRAGITVRRIDFSRGMMQFKDDTTKNVYPVFFAPADPIEPAEFKGGGDGTLHFDAQVDNHRPYKDLPLEALRIQAQRYFWPSPLILDVANDLREKAGVNLENTLAVYCRGTDKSQEVVLASTDDYISAIEAIDKSTATKRDLLVQTDQEQVLEAMTAHFGARVRSFSSIPTTRGNVGIHDLDFANELKLSRERFSIELIAAIFLISQCAQVVTTTSNVGLWISIYRGNAKNLYQFSAEGRLVSPGD